MCDIKYVIWSMEAKTLTFCTMKQYIFKLDMKKRPHATMRSFSYFINILLLICNYTALYSGASRYWWYITSKRILLNLKAQVFNHLIVQRRFLSRCSEIIADKNGIGSIQR